MMNATELSAALGVSKARVSQYVSEGKLAGCFQGEGRQRRFDIERVRIALQRGLDQGQMLGNGAATRRALSDLAEMTPGAPAPRVSGSGPARRDGPLEPKDPDRYELARILNAEEDARRKHRDNARDEGRWVLADEVERASAKAMAQQIGQFEAILRDGARAIADRMGVDFREARQILMQVWRQARGEAAAALLDEAAQMPLTDEERAANL